MKSQAISAEDADHLLDEWTRAAVAVCCAFVFGNFACQIQTLGKLRPLRQHEYVHVSEPQYCTINLDRFGQIAKAEDYQLIGVRLRGPLDGQDCGIDVLLFASKVGELGEGSFPLASSFVN